MINPRLHQTSVVLAPDCIRPVVFACMAVGNANRNAFRAGPAKNNSREQCYVTMDNVVLALSQDSKEAAGERPWILGPWTGHHRAAESFNLICVQPWLRG